MSVPSDNNVAAKVFEKSIKYKDLWIEVGKIWQLKAKTIPVVVGAQGLIKTGTNAFIEKVPRSQSLKKIQEAALNGTAHVLRRAPSLCISVLFFLSSLLLLAHKFPGQQRRRMRRSWEDSGLDTAPGYNVPEETGFDRAHHTGQI